MAYCWFSTLKTSLIFPYYANNIILKMLVCLWAVMFCIQYLAKWFLDDYNSPGFTSFRRGIILFPYLLMFLEYCLVFCCSFCRCCTSSKNRFSVWCWSVYYLASGQSFVSLSPRLLLFCLIKFLAFTLVMHCLTF